MLMVNLLSLVIVILATITLFKEGVKKAGILFFFGCVLISALAKSSNFTLLGNAVWKLASQILNGIKLG